MKKLFLLTALLSHSLMAATPINGWYDTVFGGAAFLPDNLNITAHNFTRSNANYTTGYDAGGAFGFKSAPLRYEGEITYLNVELNHFDIDHLLQRDARGNTEAGFAMANVYYDFPAIIPTIEPYLGVGVGYGYLKGLFKSDDRYFGFTRYEVSDSVFSYQGTAGLTYNFAESYALNVGYRYITTSNVDNFGKPFQAHLANVGATYRFDGYRYQ